MIITEYNIIENLRRGNNDAYEYLYAHYYVALRSFANSYINDALVAEDIVQEIFVALLNMNINFNSLNELKLYLYKSVKNRAISHIRHINTQNTYSKIVISEMDTENDFFNRMIEKDIYSSLALAIETLPTRCRDVMQLTIEGYKINEIADKLLISVDTVNEHKINGKRKIKLFFKKADNKIYLLFTPLLSIIETL